jgi:DNA adenine methylase
VHGPCESIYAKLTNGWSVSVECNKARQIQRLKEQFTMLYARRLERTSIFCRDAVSVIKLTDTRTTFHYVDPPYINTDMGHYPDYTEADFIRLLDTLSGIGGKFMLSSFPSEILADYTQRFKWRTVNINMARSAGEGRKTEVLTMNYPGVIVKQLKMF